MVVIERMTVREAGYLRLERTGIPATIGWAAVLDRSFDDPRETLEALRCAVGHQLGGLPRLRQRVKALRPGLGLPIWIDDPDFRIARHVHAVALSETAAERDLEHVVEELFATPVDLSKPLWDLWLVTGLSQQRVAIVFRLHHAVADGIAAAAIATALLAPAAEVARPQSRQPRLEPSAAALLVDNVRWRLSTLAAVARPARHPLRTVRRAVELAMQLRDLWSRNRGTSGTSLNRPLGRSRRLAVVDVPLSAVKAVGHQVGATVNDVLLTAVAGGLRGLLEARGEPITGPLHASEGVSLRSADDTSASNQAGGMLVPLHADVSDPMQRLRRIAEATRALKAAHATPAVVGILDSPFLPAALTSFFERRLRSQTLVQTYVANVPGPTQPLLVLGTSLRRLIPIVPLMGNVTVVVGAASYVDRLVIGVRSDAAAVPDVGAFVDGMQATLNRLGAGVKDLASRT